MSIQAQGGVVAWRWRHVNDAFNKWHYFEMPLGRHDEYIVVEPLYAAPPASPAAPVEAEQAEESRIDGLRLAAFKSNSPADRQLYFDAVSKWFQDRHYRRMAAPPATAGAVDREALALANRISMTTALVDAKMPDGSIEVRYFFHLSERQKNLVVHALTHPTPSYRDGLEAAAICAEQERQNSNLGTASTEEEVGFETACDMIAAAIRRLANDAQPAPVARPDRGDAA